MKTINKNLSIYKGTDYKGFPVYYSPDGLILEQLDTCYAQIDAIGMQCTRALLVRFDIRFPTYFDPEHMNRSNQIISSFIEKLRKLLDQREYRKKKQGIRVYPHCMRYVWVREQSEDNGHWHYHFVLLVNKNTFQSVGVTQNIETLAGMISSAWAHALKINERDSRGLIYVPKNAAYIINYSEGIPAEAIYRVSYMCKAATKVYGLGSHVIGSSQLPKYPVN